MIRSPLTTPLPSASAAGSGAAFVLGAASVDQRLGGGLARAALHEVFAQEGDDAGAVTGFALLLAICGSGAGPLIWVRQDRSERGHGRVYPPGLAELGIDPARILLVSGADDLGVLRAGADSVACAAAGAVIIEPWGKAPLVDLTATRRLALAAARSGVLTLLLRIGASPAPSAASTRWQARAALSRPLFMAAPGRPAFDIGLLRSRSGIAGFDSRVEWDGERRSFCDAPVSRDLSALAAGRESAPGERRAA